MSFVKQTKYVSAVIAVVGLLLILFSYLQVIQKDALIYADMPQNLAAKSLLSLTLQQWAVLIWEVFWIVVGMAFFIYVARHAKEVHQELERRLEKAEKGWLIFSMIGLLIIAAITIPIAQPVVSNLLAPKDDNQKIYVNAYQFRFRLYNQSSELSSLSADKYIEFHVNTSDVTHGFGVYDEEGRLVFQMQVVPGYDNVGRVKLNPGTYSIYCLEFCGLGHHAMKVESAFTVI